MQRIALKLLSVLGCLCLAASLPVHAEGATGVGIAHIKVSDPISGGPMPGYVFYPAIRQSKHATIIGPYAIAASFGAPAIAGTKPLVVISHGHGGSNLGHHDLAEYLASHGFIVATIEHPKDNFHDTSGNGQPEVMAGRPLQIKATISRLLADPRWAKLVDANRIGVAGFSAGGYTSLLLVGAVPRFDRFIGYCDRHPQDREICELVKQLGAADTKQTLATLQKKFQALGPTDDPRVKAAFVMAPQSIVFDKPGLEKIKRPVFLYYGENDHVLLPRENALRIAPLIRTLSALRAVPKAGHYVFLAPCSEQLASEAPAICRDPA
ncbi:MAG: hypothetical protein WBW92_01075, partial [Rhodanobacteraceae bacterium]